MKTKKTTEIIIETERLLVVSERRKRTGSLEGWCAACGKHVEKITVDEAAALAQVSPRVIYQRVEAGGLHFTELPDGLLLICPNSLFRE